MKFYGTELNDKELDETDSFYSSVDKVIDAFVKPFEQPNLSKSLFKAAPDVFNDPITGGFNQTVVGGAVDAIDLSLRVFESGIRGTTTAINETKNLITGQTDDRLKRDMLGFLETAGVGNAMRGPMKINQYINQLIKSGKKNEAAKVMLYASDASKGNNFKEVLAMTAKREPSPVRQASDTEKAIPVMPVNQSSLEARGFDYQAGGRYINPITKEDLTGKNIGSANIKINPEKGIQGGKPQADFIVKNVGVSEVGSKGLNILTNLIKPSSKGKKAGWFFINKNKDIDENINTLVAVVQDNKHYYTLETDFSKGANLKTYPNQKHEPRLRPSVKGNLEFGNIVAKINMGKYPDKIKGKPHPMAGKDRIHNLYDKITAYKDGGLVKQKGLMARA